MAVQDKARVDELLKEGRTALKAGDPATAGARYRKAAEISPYDERVWTALLEVVTDPEDERVCLENILAINPNHAKANRRMAELQPPSPVVLQAEAEQRFEDEERKKRQRQRNWRSFRSGFGQGLLIGIVGFLVGAVLSVFIYGFGFSGGILDVWFAPIRALFAQ